MGIIFMPKHLIRQRQQYVHIYIQIMNYHSGNVYLRCCAKCPRVNLPDQETDDQYSETSPSIRFHMYHLIARCTTHGRLPLNDKNICLTCKHDCDSEQPKKYTPEMS